MKILATLLLLSVILGCNRTENKPQQTTADRLFDVPEPDILERLQGQKTAADTLFAHSVDKLLVWVKLKNSNTPVQIFNQQWPEGIETTFNILKGEDGKIITISEYPFSESGDWSQEWCHYFDANGKTYAFESNLNAFNSMCTEGVTYEKDALFYDKNFTKVGSSYSLKDEKGKALKKEDCNMYEFKYTPQPDLKTYLKANNLNP
jgi:hypothetical protein